MLLSNRSNSPRNIDLNFSMTGINLSQSCEMRDLGVVFDSKLNFTSHIDTILAKAKQRLYLLKKSFSSCNDHALILAFKSYVVLLLEYCCPAWSPTFVTDIVRIESIQRSFNKSLKLC